MSSALSPKTWPFSLKWLPTSACLVGGTVRDALLGRQGEYLDLDFVLPEGAVETAMAIARHYKAGYVLLDAERQIARVVFEQGTADFAQQVGATLEADLERRDFTVNAIAYNPHTDQIIDPLRGYGDLQKRQLRMISQENLREDPLRLLRAYRQAAQLGFTVEADTQTEIRQLAGSLKRIAAERVQSELNYLLGTPKGTAWLSAAWQDGLLQDWFPDATAASLERVAAIDATVTKLQEFLPTFATELSNRIRSAVKPLRSQAAASGSEPLPGPEQKVSGSHRTWLTSAKLSCLLPTNPVIAELQLRRLKYSRTEIQVVTTLLKFVPQLNPALEAILPGSEGCLVGLNSPRQQYEFFQNIGVTFPAIAVLALATGVPLDQMVPLIDRYLDPDDPVAHPVPLLSGQDLMVALSLPPGPRIGRLLAAIQLARAEGRILTPGEALKLAETLLDSDLDC